MLMIFLVQTVFTVVMFPVALLPSWTVPAQVATSGGPGFAPLTTLGGYCGELSAWFPFNQVAAMIAGMGVLFIVAAGFWFIRRVAAVLPFVGRLFDEG